MKFRIFCYSALIFSLFACTQETPAGKIEEPADGKMVIKAGFEKVESSKTLVADGTEIRWSDQAQDKVLYVFDSDGVKNVFTSSETGESATRSFVGNISANSEISWILWSGKIASEDQSTLYEESQTTGDFGGGTEPIGAGGTIEFDTKASVVHTVFAGSSLRVVNPQNISSTNSFAQDANIAVMKPGDTALRSALGYIRFTVPAGAGGHATIKSVTFHADEKLAGEIRIDYTEAEPVTRIVADGSQSLTVNTHFNGSGYEAGTLYAVLPAGTYHHMTLTVTPFVGDAATEDAETGEPYLLSSKNAVVVTRGQFTDAGTLTPDLRHKPTLHLAGDSLCCDYDESAAPQTGWGQCLAAALGGGDVQVVNRGASGASTKSYIDSGKWQTLMNGVQMGDLVLIMFAHNDSASDEARHTDPGTTYNANLIKFINDVWDKDATPVLLTSVSSRVYNNDGTVLYRSVTSYANAMKKVASDKNVACIDINEQTYQLFSSLGYEGTIPYFVMDKRNPTSMDNTHITKNGAEAVASMIAHGLKDLGVWKFDISEEPLVVGIITISSSQSVTIPAAGGSATANFSSTKNWTAAPRSGSWIHVGTPSGAAGDNLSFTFTVDANTTGAARSSYVTIRCDGYAAHIAVSQPAS